MNTLPTYMCVCVGVCVASANSFLNPSSSAEPARSEVPSPSPRLFLTTARITLRPGCSAATFSDGQTGEQRERWADGLCGNG